jgi:hypothetical protein
MAYIRSNLISRQGYSGLGDTWDDITGAAAAVVTGFGKEQQAVGAQAQAAQQNQILANALAAQSGGISTTTLMLVGAAGLAAYMLMKKKKPE